MTPQQSSVAPHPALVSGTEISIEQSEPDMPYLVFRTQEPDARECQDSRLPIPVAQALLAAIALRDEIMEELHVARADVEAAMSHLESIMSRSSAGA